MIKKQKGGFERSLLAPCTPENVEERRLAVNYILVNSDRIMDSDGNSLSPADALMQIENLIPPNGFGRSFVWMNADITRNRELKRMVSARYGPSPNIGGKSLKKKRKSKRIKSMKKKQRKTKRKGQR